MIRRMFLAAALAISTAVVSLAAPHATFILKNGERHTGTLVYRKDAHFNLLVNGQERSWPQSEVAVIEITGGNPSADELRKLAPSDDPVELERNMVVLRNGTTIHGKLYNINDNDSITFDTRDGVRRDISFSDIARIYLSAPGARMVFRDILAPATAPVPTATTGIVPGAVMVDANRQWTDTGLNIRKGDRVAFRTTGAIRFGTSEDMSAGPDGSASPNAPRGPQFPVPEMPVGGLIGRVGNTPFAIGSNSAPIIMPADGRLYLGVNDDNYGDNSGAFGVVVSVQARRRR